MATSTMTSKGQTTVPKDIRDAMKLKPGDEVHWSIESGRAIMRAKNRTAKDLAGFLHRPGQKVAILEEIDEAIANAVIERDARSRQ
jgi:AbrB family looped-hinge helix DNA binding protein